MLGFKEFLWADYAGHKVLWQSYVEMILRRGAASVVRLCTKAADRFT